MQRQRPGGHRSRLAKVHEDTGGKLGCRRRTAKIKSLSVLPQSSELSNFAQSSPRQGPSIVAKVRLPDIGATVGAPVFYRSPDSFVAGENSGKRGDRRGRPLVKGNASVAFSESRHGNVELSRAL